MRPHAVLTATRSALHTRSQGPIRSPVREPGAEEVTAQGTTCAGAPRGQKTAVGHRTVGEPTTQATPATARGCAVTYGPAAPDRHGSPAGAPLPMSRHALSYLQLTGAITPERASRIVVVSTPEGQRTPLPTRSPGQPPHEKGRNIPPGIARMLQQIRMPQARPQQLQPRREPRPNARTSRTAVLPTGPPMGFIVTSTPSPRLLSRPGQFSPSPAWSPAVTSSWHSVRHVSPEHWSPACTPGGGV